MDANPGGLPCGSSRRIANERGAGSRTRTGMPRRAGDFESPASANFAKPAGTHFTADAAAERRFFDIARPGRTGASVLSSKRRLVAPTKHSLRLPGGDIHS